MAKVTVEEFATDLKLGVDKLIEQLSAAGVTKALKPETALTEADKRKLLDYLKQSSGSDRPRAKITLTRRQTSEIKKSDSTGKARTIQVEVRKKRVLVKKPAEDTVSTAPSEAEQTSAASAGSDSDSRDIAEQQKRADEAKRQAELIAIQTAELAKKEEDKKRRQEKKEAKEREELEAQKKGADSVSKGSADGTLHSPISKDEAKKANKKKAKQERFEEEHKKRAIKTRGDFSATGGRDGWRSGGNARGRRP